MLKGNHTRTGHFCEDDEGNGQITDTHCARSIVVKWVY
jgi:hypothetical protein